MGVRSVSKSASGTRPRGPARAQARVEASLAVPQKRFRRCDNGGACQQPIFAGPRSPEGLVKLRSVSGSASGTRPRAPAR
eukprot:213704-Pyramimonas_sp.AAC.1